MLAFWGVFTVVAMWLSYSVGSKRGVARASALFAAPDPETEPLKYMDLPAFFLRARRVHGTTFGVERVRRGPVVDTTFILTGKTGP